MIIHVLWNKLSSELLQNNVNIQYSTKISSVYESDENKIALSFEDTDIKDEYFDYVFFACCTDDILSALDENTFIKEYNLLKYKTRDFPFIAATVFNIGNKIPQWFIDDSLLIGPYATHPLDTLYIQFWPTVIQSSGDESKGNSS